MKYAKSYKFWNGVALDDTKTSPPISMKCLDNAGITLKCTGVTANTGTFTIEATNDECLDSMGNEITSGISWFDIGANPAMTLAGANAEFEPNIQQLSWKYIHIKFTKDSTPHTDGVVTGKFYGKAI